VSAEALERERPDTRADSWKEQAACKGKTALFFPHETNKPGQTREVAQQVAAAKALCATCPARLPCLDYAMAIPGELHGIFGGMTQRERRNKRWTANYQRRMRQGERTDLIAKKGHGTESKYSSGDCRCEMCKKGHAAYVAGRKWAKDHSSTGLPT